MIDSETLISRSLFCDFGRRARRHSKSVLIESNKTPIDDDLHAFGCRLDRERLWCAREMIYGDFIKLNRASMSMSSLPPFPHVSIPSRIVCTSLKGLSVSLAQSSEKFTVNLIDFPCNCPARDNISRKHDPAPCWRRLIYTLREIVRESLTGDSVREVLIDVDVECAWLVPIPKTPLGY